jgi:indolepyruvate ferredoxin oxidoreductase
MANGRTKVVFNRFVAPTSAFATNPDLDFGGDRLAAIIERRIGREALSGLDATRIAMAQLGDGIGANMLLVGHAWQKGLIPLSLDSIEQAIRLNGAAVELNLAAFRLGRIAAIDPAAPARWVSDGEASSTAEPALDDLIERYAHLLEAFDGPALAARFRNLVGNVVEHEVQLNGAAGVLARAVAKGYFKTLYYKDEYEVARLLTDGTLERRLAETFEGNLRVRFNLAPPLLSRRGPDGRERKREFGPWVKTAFKLLAGMRGLRGSWLDVFGWSEHRRTERALGREFEALIEELLPLTTVENLSEVAALAGAYEGVKGYSVVKEAKLADVRAKVASGLAALREG